jgi:uncharacterized protein HemX
MTPFWPRAWAWLKKWGWTLLVALGALAGAGWLWTQRRRLLGAARDEAAVAQARQQLAQLEVERKQVEALVGEKDAAIAQVDARIEEQKREIVRLHEGGEHVADADLDAAFKELGY